MATKKVEPKKPTTAVAKKPADEAGQGEALILMGDQMPTPDYVQTGQQRGSEQVQADDLVIPRLEVVQALSPAVTYGDPGFIKGAAVGDLINSVTNQNYGKSVYVVPVHYTKQWLVWRDRAQGGGFLGAFPNPSLAEDKVQAEGGKAKGVESIDTPTHLCLLINTASHKVEEIIVSMPRTKAKISRQWNSMIRLAGGDRFSRAYQVASQVEKNAKGTFANFVVAASGFPAKSVFMQAEKLYASVTSGQRNVVMDTKGFDAGSGTGDDHDM